jgi:hypothetical protein
MKGWKAVLGCSYESLALFRILLGSLLLLELVLRFRFLHPFYSDEGTLPLSLLLEKVDSLYKIVCIHCHYGSLFEQQVLLSVQVLVAFLFTIGFRTQWTSIISWYLYLSLTLRNTWMSYILDRYFHYLLFLSIFLPIGECWGVSSSRGKAPAQRLVISPGTVAFKALVVWIYIDAGYGKYCDPLGGWFYNADPLPALDTYARHTLPAQYLYALIGPPGLRLLTPIVLYVEIFAAPLAILGSFLGSKRIIYTAIALICSLHIGIAITLRNAALLSFVACVAWCAFLPLGWNNIETEGQSRDNQAQNTKRSSISGSSLAGQIFSLLCILTMVCGNIWLETISRACDQSVKHIWSTLLHNRWNVFVGAEEYVTWEIAPGQLRDGSIVDVWGKKMEVDWRLPGSGAPCTATGRPGRWRSFPYLAGLEGEDGDALWRYLCWEWNNQHVVNGHHEKELLRYNFFMLQADVLPNMGFSATRKRLIKSFECLPSSENAESIPLTDEAGNPSVTEPKQFDEIHEEL